MQPPLKRLSTGTGQQEGQRMQDVDENFGRLEAEVDLLNANASLCQVGMTIIAHAPKNTTTIQQVDFPKTYSQTPSVVATCAMQSPQYFQIGVIGVSTTQFRLAVHNVYSSAIDVYVRWIAVGT